MWLVIIDWKLTICSRYYVKDIKYWVFTTTLWHWYLPLHRWGWLREADGLVLSSKAERGELDFTLRWARARAWALTKPNYLEGDYQNNCILLNCVEAFFGDNCSEYEQKAEWYSRRNIEPQSNFITPWDASVSSSLKWQVQYYLFLIITVIIYWILAGCQVHMWNVFYTLIGVNLTNPFEGAVIISNFRKRNFKLKEVE